MAIVTGLLLTRTTWGRYVFAAGGNAGGRTTLRHPCGTDPRIGVCTAHGTTAALAGIMAASQVGTAQAGNGTGLELAGIATTVLGGTGGIFGGEGAIWRTVLGVLLLAMIGNGFDLLGLSATYQQIVEGALIVIAVVADAWARSRPVLRFHWR